MKFMKKETRKEVRLFLSFLENHDKVAAINLLKSYGVMIIADTLLPLALGHELKVKIVSEIFTKYFLMNRTILII